MLHGPHCEKKPSAAANMGVHAIPLKMAYIERPKDLHGRNVDMLNIASGPHAKDLKTIFHKHVAYEKVFDKHPFQHFFKQLAPQNLQSEPGYFSMGVSENQILDDISVFQCLLPKAHKSLKVLLALTSASDADVLDMPGCQAIVIKAWMRAEGFSNCMIVVQFSSLVLFLFLTGTLRESHFIHDYANFGTPMFYAALITPLAAGTACIELLQFVGFACNGLAANCVSLANLFDLFRIILQFCILSAILVFETDVQNYLSFRSALAVLVFIMWVRALFGLRIYQAVGVPMLPIIKCMWKIAPFCGVLVFYLCGVAHGYYTLDIREETIESLMIVYRLGLLGDFDMDELEGNEPKGELDADMFTIDADPSENYYIARFMMVIVSFVVNITLMNIFIAVLSASYETCYLNAWRNFLDARGDVGIDYVALEEGFRALTSWTKWFRKKEDKTIRRDEMAKIRRKDDEYIWYSCRKAVKETFGTVVHAPDKIKQDYDDKVDKLLIEITNGIEKLNKEVDTHEEELKAKFQLVSEQLENLKHATAQEIGSQRKHRKSKNTRVSKLLDKEAASPANASTPGVNDSFASLDRTHSPQQATEAMSPAESELLSQSPERTAQSVAAPDRCLAFDSLLPIVLPTHTNGHPIRLQ